MLALAPACPVSAGRGTDAAPFLKVDTGARSVGMGGAFAAVADDASAIFHNPAALALAGRKEIMFSHTEWVEGIRNETLSYVHPTGTDWAFGGGARMLFSGPMKKYDRNGVDLGHFSHNEGFFSAGAALGLGDNFSAGLAVKYIYQDADKESASAYAADAGLLYYDDYLRFALAMENAGSKLKLYQDKFSLPSGYKAACAWQAMESSWLTAQVTYRPIGGYSVAAGAEHKFVVLRDNNVFARAGYMSRDGSYAGSGLALGLGVGNSSLKLDYAFTPFGDLGNVHRFSFSAKFGETREALQSRPRTGRDQYQRYDPKGSTWREQKKQLERQQRRKKEEEKENKKRTFTW